MVTSGMARPLTRPITSRHTLLPEREGALKNPEKSQTNDRKKYRSQPPHHITQRHHSLFTILFCAQNVAFLMHPSFYVIYLNIKEFRLRVTGGI